MNSINVVLTVVMFALFAVAGLLVKFPDKGDDLIVQLAKGQLFSEEGIYSGNIDYIEGTLEQRLPDGGGWRELKTGDKLEANMEIRTLADSKAVIIFNENSVLYLDEVTQLVFDNKLYQLNLKLINGLIYNEVSLVASRKYNIKVTDYQVEVANADFAVRKDFQADPELLIFEKEATLFLNEERKGNFKSGRKVLLKTASIEELDMSKEDIAKIETTWELKGKTK